MNPILIVRLNFDTLADLYNEHQIFRMQLQILSWDTLSDLYNEHPIRYKGLDYR
jgi:hypothetical protein